MPLLFKSSNTRFGHNSDKITSTLIQILSDRHYVSKDFQKRLEVAKFAMESGDHFKSSIIYQSIVDENPNIVIAWLELARLSLQVGQEDVALDYLDKAIKHNPDSAMCQISFGKILFHGGNLEKAEKHIRIAMAISPDEISFLRSLVDVLIASKRYEQAIAELGVGEKLFGENPKFLFYKAKILNILDDKKSAVEILNMIASTAGTDVWLQVELGRAYVEIGCEEEAINSFIAASELAPDDPSPKYQLAMVYQTENMTLHKAFDAMDQAIALDPNLHDDYLRGCWCMRCGDYQRAIYHFEQAVDNSLAFEPLFQLCRANYYGGNSDKAIEIVTRALVQGQANIDNQKGDSVELQSALLRFQCFLELVGGALDLNGKIEVSSDQNELKFEEPYLSETPAKIQKLQQKLIKRDLAILCHGHSIATLEGRIQELKDLDFDIWVTNRFRILEQSITEKIGRHADGIIISHPRAVQQISDHILEYLERDNPGLMVTSAWALDLIGLQLPSRKLIEEKYRNSLLYFTTSPFWPATVENPLRFPSGNTLSIALGVAAAVAPQRIFLFGADGGAVQGKSSYSHFGGGSEDFRAKTDGDMKDILENILLTDAAQFEELVTVGMTAVRQLFRQPEVPIYNVSPESAYGPFPKISYDEAISMMQE